MFTCPECGNENLTLGKQCACGYVEDDDMEMWEYDFDDAVENGLFPMDTEPIKKGGDYGKKENTRTIESETSRPTK